LVESVLRMQRQRNQSTDRVWIQVCCCALTWLLVGSTVAQLILPSLVTAQQRLADEGPWEEEQSEPFESSAEEEVPQFCTTTPSRTRRLEAALGQRVLIVGAPSNRPARAGSLIPAELSGRNGAGGPLRC